MEEIVTDVNAGWNDDDPTHPTTLGFKGSDDYIRVKVSSLPLSSFVFLHPLYDSSLAIFCVAVFAIDMCVCVAVFSLKSTSRRRCRLSSTRRS